VCWIPYSQTRRFGSRIEPELKQNGVANKSDFWTTLLGLASTRNVKCDRRSNRPLGRRKKSPPRRRQTRRMMMMAMMAVHEQSMPKDMTNMLRGHLPPPRRCPMGSVIWTFGVPPILTSWVPEKFWPL
jgi:hypothetical protein